VPDLARLFGPPRRHPRHPPARPPAAPVSDTAAPAETHRFPCAQCGAQLRYAPGQKRLTCEYCGHEQPIPYTDADRDAALETLDLQDRPQADRLPEAAMEETRVLNCGNCGAQVEFDPAQHSAQCPFCASPVVTDTGTHRHIKPAAVLPFRLTEEEAHGAMNRWLRGLWFAPTELKKYARPDRKMDGLYVPYWAFDAFARARYTGERGDAYYETRTVKGKSEQVRRIRWRRVSGRVQRQFRDVLVMAAQSLPRRFTRGLEPWMLADLSPYSPQYLSGFRAEAIPSIWPTATAWPSSGWRRSCARTSAATSAATSSASPASNASIPTNASSTSSCRSGWPPIATAARATASSSTPRPARCRANAPGRSGRSPPPSPRRWSRSSSSC
jgi:DNA-directed RNA polymerase subunit RPC12/RpoP